MRRSAALLVTAMAGLAMAPFPQPPASASCAAPSIEDGGHLVLQRGASTTIEGRSFVDGCRDSMSCSVGCDSCEYADPPEKPMKDVGLRLVQQGRTWELAVADAGTADDNQLGWVAWTFTVPDDPRPGRARLVADHAEPVRVRVR
jgi:hypothetical protein